jgi:tRNA (guanine37-N1)-methyltransferase
MKFHVISLFPEYFEGPFKTSILRRAQEGGLIEIAHTNVRDFAQDKHKSVDDRPFGGGAGMVLKPEPLIAAIKSVRKENSRVVYLTPRGIPFTTKSAQRLAKEEHLILISGHYEGIDERVMSEVDEEISIGDYVLTNGCVAAIVVIDAVVRFVPGVLGDSASAESDSFSNGLLEHAHYTRPLSVENREVPYVLLQGDHLAIERWRRDDALKKTLVNREDLYARYLGKDERKEVPSLILEVRELTKSIRFYRKAFGITLEKEEKGRASFVLDRGRRLVLVEGREEVVGDGSLHQMAISDPICFARIRNYLEKEAPFFDGKDEQVAYCRDLDGHLWMVYFYNERLEHGQRSLN